jgi:hypothetical protein
MLSKLLTVALTPRPQSRRAQSGVVKRGGQSGLPGYDEAQKEIGDSMRGLNRARARLVARLDANHPLPAAVDACRVKLGVFRMIAPEVVNSTRELSELESQTQTIQARIEEIQNAAAEAIRLEGGTGD